MRKRTSWTIDSVPWRLYLRWCCEAVLLVAVIAAVGRLPEALAMWWRC